MKRILKSRIAWVAVAFAVILTLGMGYKARKEALAQLQASEDIRAAIGALLDSTEFGYAILNEKEGLVEWNPAMERITEYSKAEVQRAGIEAVLPQEILGQRAEVFVNPDGQIKVTIIKCNLITKSGKAVPVRVTIRTVMTKFLERYFIFHVDQQAAVKSFTVKEPTTMNANNSTATLAK